MWATVAFGHGGPPHSEALLWGAADQMVVASTHGLLFEDGQWDWVCEESFGESLPTDIVRTSTSLVVASTAGLAQSQDGCDWTWNDQFDEALIWDLATDPTTPDQLWMVTNEGIWTAEGNPLSFSLLPLPEPNAQLRAIVPLPDGELSLFGFVDGVATVWRGRNEWQSAPLPVRGGQLIALGSDATGNVYGRFPLPNGTDELL